jgi:hypothetical protein
MDDIRWDFTSCAELAASHVQRAMSAIIGEPHPRDKVLSLLTHMAKVAQPGQGATKMLVVLARMAAAEWIEGVMEVRIRRVDGHSVAMDVFVDDTIDTTRLLRDLRVGAPYEEFDATVELHGQRLTPLMSKPALAPDTIRLLARGGSSAKLPIPNSSVDMQKTIRRTVPLPREAFRDAAAVKQLEEDLEGVDEGWDG